MQFLRPETSAPPPGPLLMGHFRMKNRYAGWRPHGTRDWLLIYTVAGCGYFGGKSDYFPAHAGDIVLITPGTPHDYGLDSNILKWELLWAHFMPDRKILSLLEWPESLPGIRRLAVAPVSIRRKIRSRLHDAVRLSIGHGSRREYFAMNALEEVFLWCDAINPKTNRFDERIQKALDFISAHFMRELSLKDMAQHSGLSLSRFCELFEKFVGQPPRQFLEGQRMARARDLLSFSQQSVKAIAEEIGFESPFYFSRRFKEMTGSSPREYRKIGKSNF